MTASTLLRATHISKKYGDLQVLKDVSLELNRGEIVSIVGSSGAGKSTLLHILGTLDRPDSGTLELQDTPLHELKGSKLAAFRNRHMGFVFQFHHLLPEFTALENICIPAWIAGTPKHFIGKTGFSRKRSPSPHRIIRRRATKSCSSKSPDQPTRFGAG
jgi:lipoprotein-releasing system ATP-binding protein